MSWSWDPGGFPVSPALPIPFFRSLTSWIEPHSLISSNFLSSRILLHSDEDSWSWSYTDSRSFFFFRFLFLYYPKNIDQSLLKFFVNSLLRLVPITSIINSRFSIFFEPSLWVPFWVALLQIKRIRTLSLSVEPRLEVEPLKFKQWGLAFIHWFSRDLCFESLSFGVRSELHAWREGLGPDLLFENRFSVPGLTFAFLIMLPRSG